MEPLKCTYPVHSWFSYCLTGAGAMICQPKVHSASIRDFFLESKLHIIISKQRSLLPVVLYTLCRVDRIPSTHHLKNHFSMNMKFCRVLEISLNVSKTVKAGYMAFTWLPW